jgi:hypothetical protein
LGCHGQMSLFAMYVYSPVEAIVICRSSKRPRRTPHPHHYLPSNHPACYHKRSALCYAPFPSPNAIITSPHPQCEKKKERKPCDGKDLPRSCDPFSTPGVECQVCRAISMMPESAPCRCSKSNATFTSDYPSPMFTP